MTNEEIEKIIKINQQLLLVLGFGTSIILDKRNSSYRESDDKVSWFIQAVENIVYLDKPLPPIPKG